MKTCWAKVEQLLIVVKALKKCRLLFVILTHSLASFRMLMLTTYLTSNVDCSAMRNVKIPNIDLETHHENKNEDEFGRKYVPEYWSETVGSCAVRRLSVTEVPLLHKNRC